jgi:hypothetical protein
MTDYGFDTASAVTDAIASAATGYYGNGAWIRYFDPSPNATTISSSKSNAQSEVSAMTAYGGHHLCPITEPSQSNLETGSTSLGASDASTFLTAVQNVVDWTSIGLPGSLVCYLCLESGNNLSTDYWNGWATTVNAYSLRGTPFYAGLYINPTNSSGACSTVAEAGPGEECYAIWTSTPEPCSRCLTKFADLSGWLGTACSGLPSYMWQYGEYPGCASCGYTLPAPVDLDAISSEYSALDYMLIL